MNPVLIEEASEPVPFSEPVPARDRADTSSFVPMIVSAGMFSTKHFLLPFLFTIIVPSIELGIGLTYKGDCPIKENISTYMIVAGICGLALAGMALLLKLTFLCFISDSTALTLLASCGICLNTMATIIMLIFVFVWFILGCVWVFGVRHAVQYGFPKQANYCHPVLYKGTTGLLITTLVYCFLQCCLSCCTERNQ